MLTMVLTMGLLGDAAIAADPVEMNVWPSTPPGDADLKLPPEADTTNEKSGLVAGRRLIRLGNVSTPTITVYKPAPDKDTGAAIVICPGGGYHILALDLEGTEVADWLNSIGVTGIVLKYRVPARDKDKRWLAAVQDTQRAIRLVRANAERWTIDPRRVGVLGFSAGGNAAALTALKHAEQLYDPIDDADKLSARPDFAVLVYPAYLADAKAGKLYDDVKADKTTPPMFFAQAFDDHVTPLSSLLLAAEIKRVGGTAEVHIYPFGGHGYGLRRTDEPVTTWPDRCATWMKRMGWLNKPSNDSK
ncbi:MAG: alpha/beta hydrolase fold domain-containing protein [Phycisphaera sp.]|nr:alpha/beta hydrolase fold domain-containing protein [Phycisphaera sp.]